MSALLQADEASALLDATINGDLPDESGRFGPFGGRYVPETLVPAFERLEKGRRWGLSKIYELVINNDPTYAYLVRSNSLLEQKLVMAHVYGHADFFKNNLWFAPTDRKMLDTMGNHSVRIRRYIDAFGQEEVERFADLSSKVTQAIPEIEPLHSDLQSESLELLAEPLIEENEPDEVEDEVPVT